LDLKDLIESLQSFEGVTRKNDIAKVTESLKSIYNITGDVLLDFGDDASAIDIGNNQVILLAADGIWGQIMNVNPYWAGYCGVLVNVNDIAAMGGKPLAMVDILSIKHDKIYAELMQGVIDGCKKFNIPMVGGHLHPDADFDSLGIAIMGIAEKDKLITSSGANVGDKILVAIDIEGRQHPDFPLNWDTTYLKDEILVQNQIKVMKDLGESGLVTAGKDISNPGVLGTLEMLCETSNVGACVRLEAIPRNPKVDWEDWLRSYPGAAFVLTAPKENAQSVIDMLAMFDFTVAVVGDVINEPCLYVEYKDDKQVLFDQRLNPVL
jgi:putative methanogenesis marker protein 2